MTSQIVYETIDEDFPIAGQDNNSQGFRDNFNLIKSGLSTASSELTVLQQNTAKLNADNDFNGVIIANAEVRRLYQSTDSLGSIVTNTNIDTRDADLFYGTVAASVTLTFIQWPADLLTRRIILKLQSNGSNYTVNFASSGGGVVKTDDQFPTPFTTGTDVNVTYMMEALSIDGGDTVFLKYWGEFS